MSPPILRLKFFPLINLAPGGPPGRLIYYYVASGTDQYRRRFSTKQSASAEAFREKPAPAPRDPPKRPLRPIFVGSWLSMGFFTELRTLIRPRKTRGILDVGTFCPKIASESLLGALPSDFGTPLGAPRAPRSTQEDPPGATLQRSGSKFEGLVHLFASNVGL